MARFARIVVPGVAHHVTQRGNRRQRIFEGEQDYALYRDLLAARCQDCGVEVWSYCLMPNHVHLILVPSTEEGLSRAVGETHRRYTAFVNARARVTGHLFQSRFGSVAMDEAHLLAAIRYVALNPVKAELVTRADAWPWASTRALLAGQDDGLVRVGPVLDRIDNVAGFLALPADHETEQRLLNAQGIGRPLMDDQALAALETRLGRLVRRQRRGPKRSADGGPGQGNLGI